MWGGQDSERLGLLASAVAVGGALEREALLAGEDGAVTRLAGDSLGSLDGGAVLALGLGSWRKKEVSTSAATRSRGVDLPQPPHDSSSL